MDTEFIKIRISPEVLKNIVQDVNVSGTTVTVYSGMSEMLSGGTFGSSLFTGLTIPVFLTQDINDVGYYSTFDGEILQYDVVNNFIIYPQGVGATNSFQIVVKNTSSQFISSNQLSQYKINFGDGSPVQNFPLDGYITHLYPTGPDKTYTITVNQNGPFGIITLKKQITIPASKTPIVLDPLGDAYFTPSGGSWSSTPISYKYLFTGDSVNQKRFQESKNYVTPWPFPVSGTTSSRLSELRRYGIPSYKIGPVVIGGQFYGTITQINAYDSNLKLFYTSYTIGDVSYFDYQNRTTVYVIPSSGLTQNDFADDLTNPVQTFPEDFIRLPNGDIGCKSCNLFDIEVETLDLLKSTNNVIYPEYNNKVFVSYSNCFGNVNVEKVYDTPGLYKEDFCVRRSGSGNVLTYYYRNDQIYDSQTNPTDVLSRAVNSLKCCEQYAMAAPIVKEEFLIGLSSQPEVQSNIYIERGKQAPLEKIRRLGEVDSLGELDRYGYGYFDLE